MIFSSFASIFFELIKILSGFTSFFLIFVKFLKFYGKKFFKNIIDSAFHRYDFIKIAFNLLKLNAIENIQCCVLYPFIASIHILMNILIQNYDLIKRFNNPEKL